MPLTEPPRAAGSLSALPAEALEGRTLHRVWRARGPDGAAREGPWWFASVPDDPAEGGRFDLPSPMGTCYFGSEPVAAVLEALQSHLVNLPSTELTVRRRSEIRVPENAPRAAALTAARLAGERGITAELWAGRNRALTQRWAAALRRDGWWALHSGIAHDPSGSLRAVVLFDHAGAHAPTHTGAWEYATRTLHDDTTLLEGLERFGVTLRDPGVLPFAEA